MILGVALTVASFALPMPGRIIDTDNDLSYSSAKDPEYHGPKDGRVVRYVGGDYYNIQIEATIRSGEIAGAKTTKAMFFVGGAVLFGMSLIAFGFSCGRDTARPPSPPEH